MNFRHAVARAALLALVAGACGCVAAETFNPDVTPRRLVKETIVTAPPAMVFRAWTDPAIIPEFFAPKADVELTPGGRYELLFLLDAPAGERGCEGCTVRAFIPDEMLAFSWSAPPKFPQARGLHTWVVLQFEALPDSRTRVRLTHYGFGRGDEWDQVVAYFDRAWGSVMKSLTAHFAAPPPPKTG